MPFQHEQEEADSIDAQKAVLDEALDKFVVRNAVHQDLWKEDDLAGIAQSMKSKTLRIGAQASSAEPNVDQIMDDAVDLINYAGFLIRKVRGG
jgi:hypothetical protein